MFANTKALSGFAVDDLEAREGSTQTHSGSTSPGWTSSSR